MSKTALITGASSGIGRELAKLMAKDGYDLVLVARSTRALEDLASELEGQHKIKTWTISLDLAQRDAPTKLFAETQKRGLMVDTLVNNAGFGQYGRYDALDLESELEQIQLNITTLTHLTKLFLGPMIERRKGQILNVSSLGAFVPGPLMSVYCATKAYVFSYSMALTNELKDMGITVTCLCPGPSHTGFQQRAGMSAPITDKTFMDVADVARIGYRALNKGKSFVIPGVANKILAQVSRVGPRNLVTAISRKVLENKL